MFHFFFSRAPLRIAAIVFCGIASGVASVALIALVNDILVTRELAGAAALFLGLCLIAIVTQVLSQVLLGHVSQRAIADLRALLSSRILAVPLREIERYGQSSIVGLLSGDIAVVAGALLSIPTVAIHAIIIASCMGYLAWLSPSMFLPVFGTAVAGVACYWAVAARANRSFRRVSELEQDLYRHFGDLTLGVKELKLSARRRELFIAGTLHPTIDACRKQLVQARNFHIGAYTTGQLLLFVLLGVVVGPQYDGVEVRILSGYVLVLLYMAAPFAALMSIAPVLVHAAMSWRKIDAFSGQLVGTQETLEAVPHVPPLQSWQSIELDRVTFSYTGKDPDDVFRLGPLDLSIRRGEVLFIAGGNGSGKTTLAKILTGLYDIDGGEIRIGGVCVDARNVQRYRESFSAVFTDFHLFDTLAGDAAGVQFDTRVRELIAKLHLTDHVDVERGKLSTLALSHGQRKRLALLSAYLEDRPVYVFDEWAADQDPAFRRVFYNDLLRELKAAGKTVIVISHDERFFGCADRIVRLEYGKIVPAVVTA